VDFDVAKDAANLAKHGLSLARAEAVDIQIVVADDRRAYGEPRFLAFGLLDGRPCCLAFTIRNGAVRPISLRRAHLKEYQRHVPLQD
jgi:uncharacterized DUF497 family protein